MTNYVDSPARQHKLSSIEAARGIAAVMVVFYHAARHLKADFGVLPWNGSAQFGHAGVDFFFVLSGFIILFVHQRDLGNPSRLLAYFERRLTRIYPLFWVSLIVGLVLTLLSNTQKLPSLTMFLQHATLLPFGGEVGIAWTLQHEILFYLFFAAAMINRRVGIAVFALWLCLIMASWVTGASYENLPAISRLASVFNLEFFFGMIAAYFVKNHVVSRYYLVLAAGVTSFSGFALAENIGLFNGYAASAQVAYGLSAMLIVIGVASANLNGCLRASKFLTQLGTASYSIYLLHLPCIGVIYKVLAVTGLLAAVPLDLLYFVLSAGAIAVCIVISRAVEYPLMHWVRKVIGGSVPLKNEPVVQR